MASKLRRPDDADYYVEPWSDNFLQGDLFKDVPIAIPAPPDAVFVDEGDRRFVSGPFDAGPAMLISPSCAIAAQGPSAPAGAYAHPARTLIPVRPVEELLRGGAIPEHNVAQTILSTLEGAMLVARPYGDLARFDATANQLLAGLTP